MPIRIASMFFKYWELGLGFIGFFVSSMGEIQNEPITFWGGMSLIVIAIAKGLMDIRTKSLEQQVLKKKLQKRKRKNSIKSQNNIKK